MANMNRIIIIGRLTRDPELNRTASGVSYARFTVAVDRPRPQQQSQTQADFIPCVAWNKTAENLAQYCGKGSLVAVEGSLQSSSYQDKNNPEQRRTSYDVRCSNVQFLSTKNAGTNGNANANNYNGGNYNAGNNYNANPAPANAPNNYGNYAGNNYGNANANGAPVNGAGNNYGNANANNYGNSNNYNGNNASENDFGSGDNGFYDPYNDPVQF